MDRLTQEDILMLTKKGVCVAVIGFGLSIYLHLVGVLVGLLLLIIFRILTNGEDFKSYVMGVMSGFFVGMVLYMLTGI